MDIELIEQGPTGTFVATEAERELGKMIVGFGTDQRLVIVHTEVFPGNEGRGIGKQLVLASVEHARRTKSTVVPQCSFAKRLFERTPAWADVLA